jgi:hypothetical protein
VAKILDTVKKPIDALIYGEHGTDGSYCKVGKDSKACEIMMLGSSIPGLAKAGLFPVPEPEKFTGSLYDLQDKLNAVETIPYIGKDWMPHMSHDNCDLGFRESAQDCLKDMMVPLSGNISKLSFLFIYILERVNRNDLQSCLIAFLPCKDRLI